MILKHLKAINKAYLMLDRDNKNIFIGSLLQLLDRIDDLDFPTTYTTTLESQIDQLVYELYGLTEEEFGVVEGSVNK